ncbi:RNA dependent RNA polymerase [Aspergillus undulatus]|uniref:RNA dependent RNA polymerase n=1 Tax=Aspergillus undulatus TaxID=1810928 RepID=UPI003CCDBFC5
MVPVAVPTVPTPRTPQKSGGAFNRLIDNLNERFSLGIPNPRVFSPGSNKAVLQTPQWQCFRSLQRLYWNKLADVGSVIGDFEDWVISMNATDAIARFAVTGRRGVSRALTPSGSGSGTGPREVIAASEREERLGYLIELIDNELYIVTKGSHPIARKAVPRERRSPERPLKRRFSSDESSDDFHTAPNSPEKSFGFDGAESDDAHKVAKTAGVPKHASTFVARLTPGSDKSMRYDLPTSAQDLAKLSFSTFATDTGTPSFALESSNERLPNSFNTMATYPTEELTETSSAYADSTAALMLSEDPKLSRAFTSSGLSTEVLQYSSEGEIVDKLLQSGPFSYKHTLPGSIPLLYRYELERIGRAWNVPLNHMLAGDSISLRYDGFWKWIEGHSQQNGKPIPEKSTRKAWDAACGTYKTERHSEVVVLTGDLEWCTESEPGVLKLVLKPLKTERSCRFYRRYGSDRFLSLTLPAPARPPSYLRFPSNPALLREMLGENMEAIKQKRKIRAEPTFRVEFFAIDGIDFAGRFNPSFDDSSHRTSTKSETSESRTPMSLQSLLEWHLSPQANLGQTNLKLFQRMSLGLSKTFATVVLKPKQVFYLHDDPNHRVMNDGCALMSRQLANQICDSLGITGNIPSAFQGRIAGAKGLWMVDAHQSHVKSNDDVWIQISDSQLKINPHPREWKAPVDDEKLTFEVVKWSKPPHPVDLNIQLLAILDHGGNVKDHIADLARLGIQGVAQDFEEVLRANSPILCRSLAQKLRPSSDSGSGFMSDFHEAGFAPRGFYPLRKRLGRLLRAHLERYVEELRIEVPLSTYAFCIADPYGVLGEDEVHFGLSINWRDDRGQFEDNLLDGIDVLVGRLPAHLPSDIQRRRVVWKSELRHFKDVIIFPTTGDHPLADTLSGGDYDGDIPWICWDQNIVRNFYNSDPPNGSEHYPPEYFGLTKHSVPMKNISSTGEFLESSFTFNLLLSNLGRCTVEHEKLSYDESIDSQNAKELSVLLSHLVDGRKAGVHLSEAAWQTYRKKISPWKRVLPAYKNADRRPKRDNIIDHIRFVVSCKEKKEVLTKLEKLFPENEHSDTRDPDLVQLWIEAREKAEAARSEGDTSLYAALKPMTREIESLRERWSRSLSGGERSFPPLALKAAEEARAIPSPGPGNHPLIHVWRHSQSAWLELVASYAYNNHPRSSFVLHAFGETLCQIKSRSLPSRTVSHEVLACYRVNNKVIARLQVQDGIEDEETEGGEYEGHEAIEAMLYGTQGVGGYYDPDDSMSVE